MRGLWKAFWTSWKLYQQLPATVRDVSCYNNICRTVSWVSESWSAISTVSMSWSTSSMTRERGVFHVHWRGRSWSMFPWTFDLRITSQLTTYEVFVDDDRYRSAVWEHCHSATIIPQWSTDTYVPRFRSRYFVVLHLFSGERRAPWLAKLFGGDGYAGQLHTASLISWRYFWPGEWWSGVRKQSAEMGAFRYFRLCGYDFCRPPLWDLVSCQGTGGGGWSDGRRRRSTCCAVTRKPPLHFLSWKWRKQNRCYRRIDSSFSAWSFSSSWPIWTSSWWLSIRPGRQGLRTHGLRQSGNYLRPRSTSTIRLSGRLRWCRDISEVNLQNPPLCYLQADQLTMWLPHLTLPELLLCLVPWRWGRTQMGSTTQRA